MKYVFFGTPRFAEIVLGALIEAHMPPVALVCNPDRPVGRRKAITPPPAKRRALESDGASIDILQPERLDDVIVRRLRGLEPDLFVVAAYAKIIPREILAIPRLGTIGVHPSLLPKYRGASPIQSAILHSEASSGVSLYDMDEKMDHGPVLLQESCDAGSGALEYLDLEERLANLAGTMLVKALPKIAEGKLKAEPQDESKATYTKKFSTEDGFIEEARLTAAERGEKDIARELLAKINALNPEPGVWTIRAGKRMKILRATLQDEALKILEIQYEGGRPLVL